jgi:TolA-binding protein
MQKFLSFRVFIAFVLALVTTSCVTPVQKKEIQDDIQTLKMAVASLQTSMNDGRSHVVTTGEVQQRNLASTNAEMDRLQQEVKRIKGDIDVLKVGVTQGQLPGQEAPAEGTVASQLAEIRARLDAIESRLAESAVNATASTKKSGDKKETGASSINASIDSLEQAYNRKRYKEVVEDAPSVLKKSKGKSKERALIVYGDSLMRIGRHKEAALQFNEVIESKPNDKIAAYAKLKVAECFKAMGDKETSRLFYDEIIARYPDSPEADKAKKAIGSKK